MWSGAGGGETSDNAPPGQQKSERSTVQHIASQLRKSSSDHLRPQQLHRWCYYPRKDQIRGRRYPLDEGAGWGRGYSLVGAPHCTGDGVYELYQ